jgi:Zn-dependent protease
MISYLFTNPILFLFWAAALLIGITIHEFAHAWTADRLGDPTGKMEGRMSLNPIVHLDLIGTALILFTGFGWGKPVPFDPYNLKDVKKDSALISLAGPVSSFLVAIVAAILIRLSIGVFSSFIPPILISFLYVVIQLNVMLGIFNLIPIHPLDGGKVLIGLLPDNISDEVDRFLTQYGLMILLFLFFFPFGSASYISMIISPVIKLIFSVLLPGSSII